jgi:hypothetical protein
LDSASVSVVGPRAELAESRAALHSVHAAVRCPRFAVVEPRAAALPILPPVLSVLAAVRCARFAAVEPRAAVVSILGALLSLLPAVGCTRFAVAELRAWVPEEVHSARYESGDVLVCLDDLESDGSRVDRVRGETLHDGSALIDVLVDAAAHPQGDDRAFRERSPSEGSVSRKSLSFEVGRQDGGLGPARTTGRCGGW